MNRLCICIPDTFFIITGSALSSRFYFVDYPIFPFKSVSFILNFTQLSYRRFAFLLLSFTGDRRMFEVQLSNVEHLDDSLTFSRDSLRRSMNYLKTPSSSKNACYNACPAVILDLGSLDKRRLSKSSHDSGRRLYWVSLKSIWQLRFFNKTWL